MTKPGSGEQSSRAPRPDPIGIVPALQERFEQQRGDTDETGGSTDE